MTDFRVGQGFDVHRLAENRKLILCGVEIPYELGLLGHSDADVAIHALIDALLGALALGDIGEHFPDTDPKWKGADSRELLYSDDAVPPCRYVRGSRPLLEGVVASCAVPGDEQATALNLMRFCRDLYRKRGDGQPLAYGGTEEAMIERVFQIIDEANA